MAPKPPLLGSPARAPGSSPMSSAPTECHFPWGHLCMLAPEPCCCVHWDRLRDSAPPCLLVTGFDWQQREPMDLKVRGERSCRCAQRWMEWRLYWQCLVWFQCTLWTSGRCPASFSHFLLVRKVHSTHQSILIYTLPAPPISHDLSTLQGEAQGCRDDITGWKQKN